MKKYLIVFFCGVILFSIAGCNNRKTEESLTKESQQENPTNIIENNPNLQEDTTANMIESNQNLQENTTANRIESNQNITWNEITKDGVDEQELLNNVDMDVLEEVADLLQTLDKEIAEKESISPEYVLRGDWVKDVIESEQYSKVISKGTEAMKPLYWIIYKSDNQGRYEYICALALDELSGFNFDEDGDGIGWATSKEFLEEFNRKVIDD